MKFFLYLFIILIYSSCDNNKKIEITAEYIVNENWNELANSIKIDKMILKKDSVIDLFKLNQLEVINKLQEDSSFSYVANVKFKTNEEKKSKMIYFNHENDFFWLKRDLETKIKVLGSLEKRTWFKFSRLLTHNYDIYIYIDSLNNVFRQDVVFSNF